MRHARFEVAHLLVEGVGMPIRMASLLVAQSDDGENPHWECLAYAVEPVVVARGIYRLEMTTLEGRTLSGDAVLVRSVEGAHVLRGAGPLAGVDPEELA